jgi:hypothetical protein
MAPFAIIKFMSIHLSLSAKSTSNSVVFFSHNKSPTILPDMVYQPNKQIQEQSFFQTPLGWDGMA